MREDGQSLEYQGMAVSSSRHGLFNRSEREERDQRNSRPSQDTDVARARECDGPGVPHLRHSDDGASDTAASSELARLALRLCGASVLLRVLDRVDGRERPPAALMLARLITSCDPSDSIVGIR